MKRLFTVEVKAEIVVVAESEREAERIADGISKCDLDLWADASVLRILPNDWDEAAYPHIARGEKEQTIAEWIKAGAGEELLKARAEWEARVNRARAAQMQGTRNAVSSPTSPNPPTTRSEDK